MKLTTMPISILPYLKEPYAVYYDASKKGLGDVLMQNGYVVSITSRQMKVHERNYPTHDLDLVNMVFMLKLWKHYLCDSKF